MIVLCFIGSYGEHGSGGGNIGGMHEGVAIHTHITTTLSSTTAGNQTSHHVRTRSSHSPTHRLALRKQPIGSDDVEDLDGAARSAAAAKFEFGNLYPPQKVAEEAAGCNDMIILSTTNNFLVTQATSSGTREEVVPELVHIYR